MNSILKLKLCFQASKSKINMARPFCETILLLFTLISPVLNGQDLSFECGKRENPLQIVISSEVGIWPWMGSLGFYSRESWVHQCGCTLISQTCLTTAAHCAIKVLARKNRWLVRLGDNDLTKPEDDNDLKEKEVLDVIVHPDYVAGMFYFDIAVLKIDRVEYSAYVRPVCLPQFSNSGLNIYDGRSALALGWGRRTSKGDKVVDLRRENLSIYEYNHCNSTHKNSYGSIRNTVQSFLPDLFQAHLLCAGTESESHEICDGDSGGPLTLFNTREYQHVIIGSLVGDVAGRCGDINFPGVYVRMDHPMIFNFIQSALEGSADSKPTIVPTSRLVSNRYPCGKIPEKSEGTNGFTRIVSAEHKTNWPWMASIGLETEDDEWEHKCGSTLITPKFVMSAAHCFTTPQARRFSVRLGSSDLSDPIHQIKRIKRIVRHPSYKPRQTYFDVAIIEIEEVKLSSRIVPICLPRVSKQDSSFYSNWATHVLGWGAQFKSGGVSSSINKVQLSIYDPGYCNETHAITGGSLRSQVLKFMPKFIQSEILCAGSTDGSMQGSCEGDSGGPLQTFNASRRVYTQIGIVSGGVSECGDTRFPGIYVRVDHPSVLSFIKSTIGKRSSEVRNFPTIKTTTTSTTTTATTTITATTTNNDCVKSFPDDDQRERFDGICSDGFIVDGILIFKNGDLYKGTFLNNEFHGQGHYLWANGDEYEGSFSLGLRNGYGKISYADSDPENRVSYVGQWRNNSREGYGVIVWKNGTQVESEFKDNLPSEI